VAAETAEPDTSTAPVVRRTNVQSLSRFVMIFLALLAVWAIIDPALSQTFGSAAGFVLYPVIGFGGAAPVITILIAGLLTTSISSILRHHYTDWIKMMRFQRTSAALRKEQMDALRKGNQSQVAKYREIQQDLMRKNTDIQFAPMKSMMWTFFLFIVIFTWLRFFVDQVLAGMANQYFAVPWSTRVFFDAAYLFPSWILLYSLLALPFGQIMARLLKYIRFRRILLERNLSLKPESETVG
jgi:uncharacterized membrane protein (DUF106 family)